MESAIRLYAWNLKYAKVLVKDLSESQCTESGGPGLENHPAWTIGQLASWRRARGLPSALATL